MSTFVLTAFDPAEPPLRVEAESHALEGGSHVFRRTAVVLGQPRAVVVRRISVALVASVEQDPGEEAESQA